MQFRRTRLTIAAAALATTAAVAGTIATAAPADATASVAGGTLTSFDSKLLTLINNVRASHGLVQLAVAAGTTDVAHGWTCHLAASQALAHNASLLRQLETHGSRMLTRYDENVGMSSTDSGASWLFNAYMRSPEHRANILDASARYIGIWTKSSGRFRYNTIDFVGSRAASYSTSYGAMRTSC